MKTRDCSENAPDQRVLLAGYTSLSLLWLMASGSLRADYTAGVLAECLLFMGGFAVLTVRDWRAGRRMLSVFPSAFALLAGLAALAQAVQL